MKKNNVLILILSLIVVGLITYVVTLKVIEKNNNSTDKKSTEDKINNNVEPSENTSTNPAKSSEEHINLDGSSKSINFDNLKLDFKGYPSEDKAYYNYILSIYVGEKEISNTIFNNLDDFIITSRFQFDVYKVGNVYILKTFNGHQCVGHYAVIINSNGEILKSFYNVSFSISDNSINVQESSFGGCCPMGDDDCLKNNIKEYTYKVEGSNLIEK